MTGMGGFCLSALGRRCMEADIVAEPAHDPLQKVGASVSARLMKQSCAILAGMMRIALSPSPQARRPYR